MQDFLKELDEIIYDYESTNMPTVSLVLYYKQNGILNMTYWNGGFHKFSEIQSFNIREGIDLKDCKESILMNLISNIVKKHSGKFESIYFILGISTNTDPFNWNMFVWDGTYKYAGVFEYTNISEESC